MTEHTQKKYSSIAGHDDNRVCEVIRWHICKNFDIPVPENLWEHQPKAITENMEVPLTNDLMIPSSMNIENKALQPDVILRYKKREEGIDK